MAPLLEIRGLRTHFSTDDGIVRAVDGVDITINKGETLCVVGESGCGKTVTAMSILKLIAMPPGRIVSGEIIFDGRDLVPLGDREMDELRAREIGFIFQEPMTSLNPVLSIGEQIAESLRRHEGLSQKDALARTVEMLRLVQIPNAAGRVHDYPHQFSGGMRQRVMIAMALACKPKLVIADEPTTALDVTIQAQVLNLIGGLVREREIGMIMISHDLSVLSATCQRLAVMYAGKIVEEGPSHEVFTNAQHPYAEALAWAFPIIGDTRTRMSPRGLPGDPPDPAAVPSGCSFHPRCAVVRPECSTKDMELWPAGEGRVAACVRVLPDSEGELAESPVNQGASGDTVA